MFTFVVDFIVRLILFYLRNVLDVFWISNTDSIIILETARFLWVSKTEDAPHKREKQTKNKVEQHEGVEVENNLIDHGYDWWKCTEYSQVVESSSDGQSNDKQHE